MQIYQIYGEYAMAVYAARTQEEAWALFLEDYAFVFDDEDRPATADDLSYPWDGCTIDDMDVMDVTTPGRLTCYME